MTIDVAGGLYREICVRPQWDRVFGSAGRAAVALGSMGVDVRLHSYVTDTAKDIFGTEAAALPIQLIEYEGRETVSFRYLYDSARPVIRRSSRMQNATFTVDAENVLRFGMLEGDAVVNAKCAVYDPQNVGAPISFSSNGSRAERLALVLNAYEARVMAGLSDGAPPEASAELLANRDGAEVVVIKMGPAGALVWSQGAASTVPAYRTTAVWKIGSGDTFAAHFAWAWMLDGKPPAEAAVWASKATAFYCENRLLPTAEFLRDFSPREIRIRDDLRVGEKPQVYLAGPFFDVAQIWFIEELRDRIAELGLRVFSPFHDIGLGAAADVVQLDIDAIRNSDIVFAVADGIDAGTLYEVGYARAIGKPVVVLAEREGSESMKMAEGSGCFVLKDLTTALYTLLWEATCA